MISKKQYKILFIGAGEPNASSRYRAEQFVEEKNNKQNSPLRYYFYSIQPDISIRKFNNFIYLLLMIIRKIASLFICINYDVIYLQRNPVKHFSPYYELIVKRILRKKVVFDFDDDLWIITGGYDKRIDKLLNIVDLVVVGNQYLKGKALKFNKNTIVIPTVVNTDLIQRILPISIEHVVRICWSGSKPGNMYLESIEDVLIRIKEIFNDRVEFVFSSDVNFSFKKFKDYIFIPWNKESEKEMLLTSHIGLMPLPTEDEFAQGKCGFKLILYGAYSMALIASPVGVNKEIINDGVNGYLVDDVDGWISSLIKMIEQSKPLNSLMTNSRNIIMEKYSMGRWSPYLNTKLMDLIQSDSLD